MKRVTLRLTVEELGLLATLAGDQLFRKEFIDPRMPGYKIDSREMSIGKAIVARLRRMVDPAAADRVSARTNGITL